MQSAVNNQIETVSIHVWILWIIWYHDIYSVDVLGPFEAPKSTINEIGDQTHDSKSIQGKSDDHRISKNIILLMCFE